MATNLLLEGDDLEALLIKAHSEGGPNARIVRADKYRHGGLWGFFARERFEVAVEIPEARPARSEQPEPAGAAFFLPADAAGGTARTGPDGGSPDGGLPTSGSVPPVPAAVLHAYRTEGGSRGQDGDAYAGPTLLPYRPADPLTDPLTDPLPYRSADPLTDPLPYRSADPLTDPLPYRSADPLGDTMAVSRRERPTPAPTPAGLAADALLGIADRVSAAEHAARTAEPLPARSPDRTIDLPGDAVNSGRLPAETVMAGRTVSPGRTSGTGRPAPGPTPAPADVPTNGTVTSTMSNTSTRTGGPARQPYPAAPSEPTPSGTGQLGTGQLGTGQLGTGQLGTGQLGTGQLGTDNPRAMELLIAAAAGRSAGEVPHEPAPSPVRPSTSRPEFTALLDQLRDGARPSRRRDPLVTPDEGAGERLVADRIDTTRTNPEVVFDPPPPVEKSAAPAPVPPQATAPVAEQNDDDADRGGRQVDPRTEADRRALRALGVPEAWTRRLRPGDRFGAVLRMLERMPDADIDPDTAVVAVVGPVHAVRLEAHRTAIDLASDSGPRPVVAIPATIGTARATAIGRALRSGPVVVAVESDRDDISLVLDTLTTLGAGAVIAVVDATAPLEVSQRWLDALGQVDALVMDGATRVADPAGALQLGLPVIRLDGIPVDRVTWTALLCAQLLVADQAAEQAGRAPARPLTPAIGQAVEPTPADR